MGGTINGTAVLWVVVSAVGTDTVLAKIMRVVSDAQLRKPQIQVRARVRARVRANPLP